MQISFDNHLKQHRLNIGETLNNGEGISLWDSVYLKAIYWGLQLLHWVVGGVNIIGTMQ